MMSENYKQVIENSPGSTQKIVRDSRRGNKVSLKYLLIIVFLILLAGAFLQKYEIVDWADWVKILTSSL